MFWAGSDMFLSQKCGEHENNIANCKSDCVVKVYELAFTSTYINILDTGVVSKWKKYAVANCLSIWSK